MLFRSNIQDELRLRKLASKDSKQLSPAQRESSLLELRSFCEFRLREITASELNRDMKIMSLNDIEARAMAELIKNHDTWDTMIDMPDRYAQTFRARMEKFGATKFEAQHKADENYPIVAAASICAKVTRDARIAEIKTAVGFDFGSGYTSDEQTIAALNDKAKFKLLKPYIRERWKTIQALAQRKLFDGDDSVGESQNQE